MAGPPPLPPDYQRATPRFSVRLSVEVRIDGKLLTGNTKNISMGGVCIELERKMQEGSTIEFNLFVVEEEIESESDTALPMSGTIQWTAEAENGFMMGIKFLPLSDLQKEALEKKLGTL